MSASYRPLPILKIDGKEATPELMEDILQIVVEESLHLPGMFTLVIDNPYFSGHRDQDKAWRHASLLTLGKKVEIGFNSSTSQAQDFSVARDEPCILEGEITGIEAHFSGESQAPIIVRGYDVAHRLHRGRYNRSFLNMTDSDIVNRIIGEVGIPAGTVERTGSPHEYLFQENQTNMEFLRERAARLGFELYVQNGKLNFRKPKVDATLDLKWLKDIHSFRVRMTSAEQVGEVEVRGWDYTTKKAIVSTANSEQIQTSTENGKGSASVSKFRPAQPKAIVVDQPMFVVAEADQIAKALYNELGGEFVCADAKGEGNALLRVGKVVKLQEMGTYSGQYYVTETRHIFQNRTYTTEFSVRGLRGGTLLDILAPARSLEPGQTLMVGVVTNNKDPKGWGRVKIKFPTLTEAHESNWARVVSIGAGPNRGFDCLPEVNDEVLVAFEHGDIHRPYVLGGVWNGTDPTPEKVDDDVVGGKTRLRTFKTRLGHKLQFVEEDKGATKCGVYIQTQGGHHIRINDSEKFVEVQTAGGHKLRLDDQGQKITMSSIGSMEIKAAQDIKIQAGTSFSIQATTSVGMDAGTSMKLGATGTTNISGAMVNVSGFPIKLN
ncbi:VgrG-related protein [Anthocerotibacter panamensis]|uniref:VgrG-related protein n=1 Tax=Anthocerotibacter panamensis TaxID=2857077 RepID=UPI001C405063|nr:VgrG-related protein [Anthocerotibacter panamensis]